MTIKQQKSIDFFRKTIIDIMHNEYKKPLGEVLHDCGLAKADIKRQFPKYEKKNSVNKSDNYDWDAFFSENMTPDFEIEHNVKWQDGRKSDAIKYNKYAPANKNKLEDNAIIITKETKTPVKNEDVKQTEKTESKQIKLTDMDNTENQNQGDIRERIEKILSYLNQNLYGKEEAVRLALLSAIANESIFFLGPPGTAKSMISRRIAAAFSDFYKDGNFTIENGDYFEYLMNEFSTPDEICGPVDLSALNENPSRYERQIKGYLPSAKVAFLDEIWKSGPAILNTLLTIINEKKFHNGNKVEKVPLVSLAAASNELPQKDRGLEALWDRFVLRVLVNPVENEVDFFNIVDEQNTDNSITDEQKKSLLTIDEITQWQEKINKITLSDDVKDVITAIRKEITNKNNIKEDGLYDDLYYVSDRRWKKIVHILKTSAFLNGRDAVDLMDCSLIEYAIWNTDKQRKEVCGIIEKIFKQNSIDNDGDTLTDFSDQIELFKTKVEKIWFDHIVQKAVPSKEIKVNIDGEDCYECTKNDTKDIWYVGVNRSQRTYYDYHNIYLPDKRYLRCDNFYKNGHKISCGYDFTVNKTKEIPDKDSYEPKVFDPGAKKMLLPEFEKRYYTPILDKIDSEIERWQSYREDNAEPFENNLFTQQKYSNVLLAKFDDVILNLKKKKSELEKQRARYFSNTGEKINFKIGDLILKDGSIKEKEYKGENIIGQVCMIEPEPYAICSIEISGTYSFTEAISKAQNIKNQELSQLYTKGWNIPTLKQWEEIRKHEKELGYVSFSGKYWSSTTDKEAGGAYYYDFASGETECTLLKNKYKICLIRKLSV